MKKVLQSIGVVALQVAFGAAIWHTARADLPPVQAELNSCRFEQKTLFAQIRGAREKLASLNIYKKRN
jgi:hypothetical protein